jgi:hypothetical protein
MRSAAFATRALRLVAASISVVAALTVVGVASKVGPVSGGCAQASSMHHATLVVEHGNGAVTKLCVSFTGGAVTGQQLLDLSRVPYNTVDFGSNGKAVCQIEAEPPSYPPSCWTASSPYWAIFVSRGGGAWTSSSRGISTQTFSDGDAEGFRYEGQSDNSAPVSSAGVCPPPVPPTPTPVSTSAPARSALPGPTAAARSVPASPAPVGSTASAGAPAAGVASAPPQTPGGSSTPPAAAQVRAGGAPPPPASSSGAGVWLAAVLGVSLLALLGTQLARSRRTRTGP